MENSPRIQFLTSFFNLFEAKVFITKMDHKNDIYGKVFWEEDDDEQDFRWCNYFNDEALVILKDICDFIVEQKLNDNDKILVEEKTLKKKLIQASWSSDKAEKGIECLMLINIRMIDEGEETDSFFLHF